MESDCSLLSNQESKKLTIIVEATLSSCGDNAIALLLGANS
jgi:hypothetical protein